MDIGSTPSAPTLGVLTRDYAVSGFGIVRIGTSYVGIQIDYLSEVARVTALNQLLLRSPYLSGGFDLRGHLIPVLDLAAICGFDRPAEAGKFAVILRNKEQLLAFCVDEVVGISHFDMGNVQELEQAPGQSRSAPNTNCINGVILDHGRPISILAVGAVFALPGVYSVKAPQIDSSRILDGDRVPMLTFEVGGASFAVRAEDVYGTVPSQNVDVNSMTSRYCLGSITYHQRRVPVLCTVSVLGVGRKLDRARTEVVVLLCSGDRLLGLAVDAIHDVQAIDPLQYSAIPRAIAVQNRFLSGVLIKEDGHQIYRVDIDDLRADSSNSAIASLSSQADAPLAGVSGGKTATMRPNERYLVFQAGRTLAVPLSQVACILQPPKAIVPITHPSQGFEGYFSRSRTSIPLVDLNAYLGAPTAASDFSRVLLTGVGQTQMAFRVERVFSIETSFWTLEGWSAHGTDSEALVQLGRGQNRRALPALNLDQVAARFFTPAK